MKANDKKPTPEEILRKHLNKMPPIYVRELPKEEKDRWNYTIEAMQEYAELYHKYKLREELIVYEIFHGNDPNSSEGWANDYLKTKG